MASSVVAEPISAPIPKATKTHISMKMWVIIAILIVGGGTAAYAAPKARDYLAVSGVINKVKDFEAKGDYADALTAIDAVNGKWMMASTKSTVDKLKSENTSFVQDQNNFNTAISDENSGDLNGAVQSLQLVSYDFPDYGKVQAELTSVQGKIQSQLENQTQQAQEQAAQAQQQAAAAQAAKAKADAAAAQAAQDKANAQAQAAAAAQAQAEANAEAVAEAAAAQQAAAERAAQVERSFMNELINAYNSANGVESNYSLGIEYSNDDEPLLAINEMTSVESVLSSALSNISDLSARYTGLPETYYNAANALTAAIDDLSSAATLVVQEQGTSIDNSFQVNSDKDQYVSEMGSVQAFIAANNT